MGKTPVKSVQTREYDALIDLLKRTREEAQISQRKLSKLLNQSSHYMANIEKGIRRLDIVEFLAIAEALRRDPQQLFEQYLRELKRRVEVPTLAPHAYDTGKVADILA